MPNWVTNFLHIAGKNASNIVANHIREEEFDFNTLIPMPKSLDINKDYLEALGLRLYAYKNNIDLRTLGSFGESIANALVRNPKAYDNETGVSEKELLAKGEKVYNNIKKYGHSDWYDWRIENWGAKWNASDTTFNECGEDECELWFATPWDAVPKIVETLSAKYPELEIEYQFAEEQVGHYVGEYAFKGGENVHEYFFEDYSKEAFERAFDLLGEEDYYRFNPEKGTYEYIED